MNVLELSQSSYLAPFLSLRHAIQREAGIAEDNLRFLQCLEGPCTELAAAAPSDIPRLLPKILNCIRIIWNISRFYNTPDRLIGLLRKLSNEINARCANVINLDDVF